MCSLSRLLLPYCCILYLFFLPFVFSFLFVVSFRVSSFLYFSAFVLFLFIILVTVSLLLPPFPFLFSLYIASCFPLPLSLSSQGPPQRIRHFGGFFFLCGIECCSWRHGAAMGTRKVSPWLICSKVHRVNPLDHRARLVFLSIVSFYVLFMF